MQRIQGDETDAVQRHKVSQGTRLRTAAWVAALTLAVTSSAVFATACWVFSHVTMCCSAHNTICVGEHGTAWVCSSPAYGGPHPVRVYKYPDPGQKGLDDLFDTGVDTCFRIPVTCSDIEGECIVGELQQVWCADSEIAGDECEG